MKKGDKLGSNIHSNNGIKIRNTAPNAFAGGGYFMLSYWKQETLKVYNE